MSIPHHGRASFRSPSPFQQTAQRQVSRLHSSVLTGLSALMLTVGVVPALDTARRRDRDLAAALDTPAVVVGVDAVVDEVALDAVAGVGALPADTAEGG